jgi:hypothetical protein
MHHIYNMLLGGRLHVAPSDKPQQILDIGTETGIWAIDIADQYPQAEGIGTDLSPIQPGWYLCDTSVHLHKAHFWPETPRHSPWQ